jgi:hypothetical protein
VWAAPASYKLESFRVIFATPAALPACPWNITDVRRPRAQLLLHGMNDGACPAGPRAAFESNEHRWSPRPAVLLLVADLFSL